MICIARAHPPAVDRASHRMAAAQPGWQLQQPCNPDVLSGSQLTSRKRVHFELEPISKRPRLDEGRTAFSLGEVRQSFGTAEPGQLPQINQSTTSRNVEGDRPIQNGLTLTFVRIYGASFATGVRTNEALNASDLATTTETSDTQCDAVRIRFRGPSFVSLCSFFVNPFTSSLSKREPSSFGEREVVSKLLLNSESRTVGP